MRVHSSKVMELPNTPERRTLDIILKNSDWTSLAQFEIRDLKRPPSTSDCGHYVLEIIGVPANPAMIETLEKLEMNGTRPNEGIVFYREWGKHGWRTMHYGHLNGEKVRSKWADGLVLEHAIAQVPSSFGTLAGFCKREQIREYLTPSPKNITLWDDSPKKEFDH